MVCGRFVFLVVAVLLSSRALADDSKVSRSRLQEISADSLRLHELPPKGVPSSYDWAAGPRVGRGNDSSGFEAFTGWGQIYQGIALGERASGVWAVELKNLQVYFCSLSSGWTLVQKGAATGAHYLPSYSGNKSLPAKFLSLPDGVDSVELKESYVLHFWPRTGRVRIDPGKNCGVIVLVQARMSDVKEDFSQAGRPRYIIGLGADYWESLASVWRGYATNKDVAIGRMREIRSDWEWFGMSTASDFWLGKFVEKFEIR